MTQYDPADPDALHNLLGATVNVYWNDYQYYWSLKDGRNSELTPEERQVHKGLDEIGTTLRGALSTLGPDGKAIAELRRIFPMMGLVLEDPLDAAEAMRILHKTAIVRDCISISLAFEVADHLLPRAQERVGELVALLATRTLSPMAAKYLERVTRLHLWGFEPEAVLMCRSVLEAALVARLSTAIVLDEPPPPLETLNRTAGQLKILPGYAQATNRRGWKAVVGTPLWEAERIRWTANQLLHEMPELGVDGDRLPDSATALRALATVLDVLYPDRRVS